MFCNHLLRWQCKKCISKKLPKMSKCFGILLFKKIYKSRPIIKKCWIWSPWDWVTWASKLPKNKISRQKRLKTTTLFKFLPPMCWVCNNKGNITRTNWGGAPTFAPNNIIPNAIFTAVLIFVEFKSITCNAWTCFNHINHSVHIRERAKINFNALHAPINIT